MHERLSGSYLLALLLLILYALGTTPLAAATGPGQPAAGKDEGERRLQAFLEAFNSGDPAKMLAYYRKNATPEFLQRRTEDERRASYERFSKEFGTLLFRGIEIAGSGEMTLVTLGEKIEEIVNFRFDLEASPPHRIKGLGIEVGSFRGEEKFPPLNLPDDSDGKSLAPALDAYFKDLERQDLFSGTVLVARSGRTIFQGAYGLASREPRTANRIDTRFDVGSITKAFTQVAIGQLARDGKLSMDDTILDHIPDYPNREVGRKVTIRHLLDHEGGLGDIFNERFMSADKESMISPRDFFPIFVEDELLFEPGESRRYSNAGFIVLGAIVAAASGQPYEKYIQEHVFKPARMEGSGFFRRDGSVENVAIGYTRPEGPEGGGELRSNVGMLPVKGCPAGSSSSSAEDLFRFDRALRSGKLLGPAWTEWYFTGSVPEGSKGTASGKGPPFPQSIGIAGGAWGVNAMLYSDGDDTAVVLTNQDPPAAMESAEKIWKVLRSGPSAEGEMSRPAESPPRIEGRSTETVLPMLLHNMAPTVEVSLNGHGPYRFFVDTGAAGTLVDTSLMKELDLPVTGEVQLGSPAGGDPVITPSVRVEKIEVGPTVFAGVQAIVMDIAAFEQDPNAPKGILGLNLFHGMLLTIDYPRDRILVREGDLRAADGAEIFQYKEANSVPTVPIAVAGMKFDAYLDTGAPGGITLPKKYTDRLPLASQPVEVGRAHFVDREMPILEAPLKGLLEIGRHSFENPPIHFAEFFPTALLGYEILSQFAITLDTRSRLVRLERSSSPAAQTTARPRRYGVGFSGLEGDVLVVTGVQPGSVAQEAGLRTGDRVVKMNGKPVPALTSTARAQMLRDSPLALAVMRKGQEVEILMKLR
jgi:CubicO group peptidase (beta-lactamase class C family)/predicted aspartyl protease